MDDQGRQHRDRPSRLRHHRLDRHIPRMGGGLYISHGPMDTTVVVPYGFLIIPLTLIFGLLARPRQRV